jgi:hypothetical protein
MIGFELLLLSAHLVADFPLQTEKMAKKKFSSPLIRAQHVAVHTIVMGIVLVLTGFMSLPFLVSYTLSHYIIDSRRWADEKEGIAGWPIIIDQILHITVLAVLAALLL